MYKFSKFLSKKRNFGKIMRTKSRPCQYKFRSIHSGQMMMSVKECLNVMVSEMPESACQKVTIVGTGHVGISCAFCILTQNSSSEICLIDKCKDMVDGERMDLEHGSGFLKNPKITSSGDLAASAGSRLCIVTAGFNQEKGESRLSLVHRNADILKNVIPELIKHSPDTILLIVTNPVDVMTYVAWKLSCLPQNRVFGSGTYLDSSRFRFFISKRLNIATSSCHGWIIGEHGDSSVPVWSGVSVAGVNLNTLNPNIGSSKDEEKWHEVHKQVVNSAYEVIEKKGHTSWGIAACVSSLTSAILRNNNLVVPLSTLVKGLHGIDEDVFLSLPCVISSNGITSIIVQNLTQSEKEKLHKSAKVLVKVQKELKLK